MNAQLCSHWISGSNLTGPTSNNLRAGIVSPSPVVFFYGTIRT